MGVLLLVLVGFTVGIATSLLIIRETERVVVIRFGKVLDVRGPGIVFITPIIDRPIRINLSINLPDWTSLPADQLQQSLTALALKHSDQNIRGDKSVNSANVSRSRRTSLGGIALLLFSCCVEILLVESLFGSNGFVSEPNPNTPYAAAIGDAILIAVTWPLALIAFVISVFILIPPHESGKKILRAFALASATITFFHAVVIPLLFLPGGPIWVVLFVVLLIYQCAARRGTVTLGVTK